MVGTAQTPSTGMGSKGLLCLRAVSLAALGALVLAASANADSLGNPVGETPAATKAPEVPPAGPVAEDPEVPPAGPVAEEAPAVPPAGPVAEEAPEVPPAAPAPEVPPAAPAPEVPPAGPVAEAPDVPSGGAVTKATETGPAGQVSGEAPEGSPSLPSEPPGDGGGEAATEVASALTDPPTWTSPVDLAKTAAISTAGSGAVGAATPINALQQTGDLGCALYATLWGRTSGSCTAGWVGAQRFLSVWPADNATASGASFAAAQDTRADRDHDSAAGSPPVSPSPGPSPGGASGGSAMGTSGLALSSFLTHAGPLLLGPPHAMRRLRLSSQPWRTAYFVLIPERPG
jgi:hypothetical protein